MDDPSSLLPLDTPEYMAPAWASALMWSAGNDEIVQQFRADTGCTWTPAGNPLAQMIDQATGADVAVARQYVEWFNVNVWGSMDASQQPDTFNVSHKLDDQEAEAALEQFRPLEDE